MSNLLYGFIFILFEFSFDISFITIGVIPDFVGYLFILNGIDQLKEYSDKFMKVRPYAKGMFIYSIVLYIFDLLGISRILPLIWLIPIILAMVISSYIIYALVNAIKDVESKVECSFGSSKLMLLWVILTVLKIVGPVISILPLAGVFAFALAVINTAVSFLFAFFFLDTKTRFDSYFTEE